MKDALRTLECSTEKEGVENATEEFKDMWARMRSPYIASTMFQKKIIERIRDRQ